MDIHCYLAKLDRMLEDSDHFARVERRYRDVFAWRQPDRLPYVWDDLPHVADRDWPEFEYNDAFADMEKMLLNELRAPFLHMQADDDQALAIRAGYGTVILPSILGGAYQLTETSLPWAHHLEGGRVGIAALLDRGVPGFRSGLGARCADTLSYYQETLRPYASIVRDLRIYHPDLQGPFDVAHLLWGPDIFVALYDCPDLVHSVLDLVTTTYIAWLTHWKELAEEGNEFTAHWAMMMRGGTMVRDDTPVMLSGAQYDEFARPYDQRVLDAFGGCIHFCGRGDQFIGSVVTLGNLYGVNMSQPDWNDVGEIWRLTREHRLVLMGLDEEYLPEPAHDRRHATAAV